MVKLTNVFLFGVALVLQACQHIPERLLAGSEVEKIREVAIYHLTLENEDPSYLPPGYEILDRQDVELVLVDKAFTLVNPANGVQFRGELDANQNALIRGLRTMSWSGDAYWEPFSWGRYRDRDKLCLTSKFCFIFSRFDGLEGNDMLGMRVHPNGKQLLSLDYRFWVFTNIDPIGAAAN